MKIGRNEQCPCGSGKKFKHCCLATQQSSEDNTNPKKKMLWERNRNLLARIDDSFGFTKGRDWQDFKRNISEAQIKHFYASLSTQWAQNTDFEQLFSSNSVELRALYLGDMEPNMIMRHITRCCLYSDQILVVDPFVNPVCVPQQYKSQTLKLVYIMKQLQPWIEKGLVLLVPDPCHIDSHFRTRAWQQGQERVNDIWNEKDYQKAVEIDRREWLEPVEQAEYIRFLSTLPKDVLAAQIKRDDTRLSEENVAQLVKNIKHKQQIDPLALDQCAVPGEGQLTSSTTGANLETALYLCETLNAFPFTSLHTRWLELQKTKDDMTEAGMMWTNLTRAFLNLDFRFIDNVDPNFAYKIRADGRLESFRCFMRRLWKSLAPTNDISNMNAKILEFSDELKDEFAKASAEWDSIDRALLKEFIPTAVAGLTSGHLNPSFAALGFGLSAMGQLVDKQIRRKQFRRRTPMSVFIDIS